MNKFLFLLLLISTTTSCQKFGKLEVVSSLPSILNEVSGIEIISGSDLIWMINDSGNTATIYGYNIIKQKIEKSILVSNGENRDWEDLTSDTLGTIFIGDFGNNENYRKDLSIYTIKNSLDSDAIKTKAIKTTFYYEDQAKYPPKRKNLNYDVEAFIFRNNNFYLFTRNRSHKFNGVTKLYKIPALEGHFMAELIGELKTCEDRKGCQITSAAIHHESGKIALLSYNKVWILSNYEDDHLFSGSIEKIKLENYSQKESITFKNENTLYIADERVGLDGGNLYLLKL